MAQTKEPNIEKIRAIEKKKLNRRVKQYVWLAVVLVPILFLISHFLVKVKIASWLMMLIFCVIILFAWWIMLLIDKSYLRLVKKKRGIKNAQKVLEEYNTIKSAELEHLENLKIKEEQKLKAQQTFETKQLNDMQELPQDNEKSFVKEQIKKSESIRNKKYKNFTKRKK